MNAVEVLIRRLSSAAHCWRRRAWYVLPLLATFVYTLLFCISGCRTPQAACFDSITVRGTPEFQKQVTNALLLLKVKAPASYCEITNYIGTIRQWKRSGMRAWTSPPVFDLANRTAFYSLTWCASSILHDSMHSELYHNYLTQNPGARRVPDTAWKGEAAEIRCSEHQAQVLRQIGAPSHEINWCTDTNRYWEIKYHDRFW